MLSVEELERRISTLERKLEEGPIQIENEGPGPALIIHQKVGSTAVVVQNDTDNPCLRLVALGNSAAQEIFQKDGEDASVGNGDLRYRAVCVDLIALNIGGSIQAQRARGSSKADAFLHVVEDPDTRKRKIIVGNPDAELDVFFRSQGPMYFESEGVLWKLTAEGLVKV